MATTINADDGVSSGSAGLKETADSSGVLALQTNGTTAVSISTGQVVTLTNALPVASGGTGATTSAAAPFALKGANSDITSLSGLTTPLSAAQGGTGTTTGVTQIQPISASVAANALTISASALTLGFRSTTLGSGTVTTVTGTPANLVISSGSTLGTVNAVASRIVVLALNNAGTIELAAVNISGGNQLDETNLITTTAEGGAGAADSANVIYSTTARSSVAYRVIGFIDSTQTTAGTWATAPSTIQGVGGQALTSLSSIGYGQTWQNPARSASTTYYNTTGKPILFTVAGSLSGATASITVTVNGVTASRPYWTGASWQGPVTATAIIPPGASYSWAGSIGNSTISELR